MNLVCSGWFFCSCKHKPAKTVNLRFCGRTDRVFRIILEDRPLSDELIMVVDYGGTIKKIKPESIKINGSSLSSVISLN